MLTWHERNQDETELLAFSSHCCELCAPLSTKEPDIRVGMHFVCEWNGIFRRIKTRIGSKRTCGVPDACVSYRQSGEEGMANWYDRGSSMKRA
jgi:hypothetical protein